MCLVLLTFFSAIGPAWSSLIDSKVVTNAPGVNPAIKLKKTRSLDVVYLSDGSVSSEKIDVSLQLTNTGDQDIVAGLLDRAEDMTSDLVMLGDTPPPSLVERRGDVTYITWEEVLVPAKSAVTYEYEGETDESLPISFQEEIYVNGERAELVLSEGSRMVRANVSDIVTWSLILTMKSPRTFTGSEYVLNPVLISVSVSLDEEAFTDISPEPKVNSTLSLGGARRINWIVVLMDSQSKLNVSARVASRGAWGVVSVDPINVQIIEDPELIIGQIDSSVKMLSASILAFRETRGVFQGLGLAVEKISQGILETESSLQSSSEETNKLQESLADLQTQIEDLLNQSSGGEGGLDQIIEMLNQSSAQVDELAVAVNASKAIHQTVINSLGLVSDRLPEMMTAMDLLVQSMEAVDEAMDALEEYNPQIRQILDTAIQSLQESIEILEYVRDQLTDPELRDQLQLVIDQLTAILQGLNTAYLLLIELPQSVGSVLAAVKELARGFRELQRGVDAMMAALSGSMVILDGILTGLPAAKEANEELVKVLNQTAAAQLEAQNELRLMFERMGANFEGISSALEMGEVISGGLREVAGSLSNITKASTELGVQAAQNVTELEDELARLQESKRTLEHFSRMVEFGGAEVKVPGAGCSFAVAPIISQTGSYLTIEKVYVDPAPTVAHNATAFVYWVWITLCSDAYLRSVEALVNGSWVAVQNTTALRISYVDAEGSILIPIYAEIPITERSNVLLDLAGHPLRITLACGSQPKVAVDADIAFYPPEVVPQRGDAASQLVLNQPQILLAVVAPGVTVTTTTEATPRVPVTAVSILLVSAVAIIILALTTARRRRKEAAEMTLAPEELASTPEIVERIEELEKELEADEEQ